jgi:hypothetical protein
MSTNYLGALRRERAGLTGLKVHLNRLTLPFFKCSKCIGKAEAIRRLPHRSRGPARASGGNPATALLLEHAEDLRGLAMFVADRAQQRRQRRPLVTAKCRFIKFDRTKFNLQDRRERPGIFCNDGVHAIPFETRRLRAVQILSTFSAVKPSPPRNSEISCSRAISFSSLHEEARIIHCHARKQNSAIREPDGPAVPAVRKQGDGITYWSMRLCYFVSVDDKLFQNCWPERSG